MEKSLLIRSLIVVFAATSIGCKSSGSSDDEPKQSVDNDTQTVSAPSVALKTPTSSPNQSTNLDITISGIETGDTVHLYNDAVCGVSVQNFVATGNSEDISFVGLSEAAYYYTAKRINSEGTESDCSSTLTYVVDNTAPDVTVEQKSGQDDPAGPVSSYYPIEFTVTFNEAIETSSFTAADISQSGTASNVTWNIENSGDDTTFTIKAIAADEVEFSGTSYTFIPSINSSNVTDKAGNNNNASTSSDNSVTMDVSLLLETDGGSAASDLYGASVTANGDITGDGINDILVGAIGGGTADKGIVFAYDGSDFSSLYSVENPDQSADGNNFGAKVFITDDKGGTDSKNDIVIADTYWKSGNGYGKVYVISGDGVGAPIYESAGQDANSEFYGANISGFDMNNDNKEDLVITGSTGVGRINIHSGSDFSLLSSVPQGTQASTKAVAGIDYNSDNKDDYFISDSASDEIYLISGDDGSTLHTFQPAGAGTSNFVAVIGDVNSDGKPDISISDMTHNSNTGAIYIYSGSHSDGYPLLHTLNGENAGDKFGSPVQAADYNGDGVKDIITAAGDYNSAKGKIYVYSGSDYSLLFSYTRSDTTNLGLQIATGGDFNSDGRNDIVIGLPNDNSDTGKILVLPGR